MIQRCVLTLLGGLILNGGPLLAQGQQQEQKETKVYEVKWRDVQAVHSMLVPFAERPADIVWNTTFRTITVTASPSIQRVITELIRKYDQPAKEIEFQFYLLRGSRDGTGVKDGVPDTVRAILRDVSSLTAFEAFELIDSPVIRAMEGGKVEVRSPGPGSQISLSPPSVIAPEGAKQEIRIEEFYLNFGVPAMPKGQGEKSRSLPFQLVTSVRIQNGETIVIGSSRVPQSETSGGDAIIVVVSARILNPATGTGKEQ